MPRSSLAGRIVLLGAVRNAWETELSLVEENPTTWPEALIPKATPT